MKNISYYLSLIFGILMLSSCDPNQDANGDFLIGVDYDSNSGTNATVKNIKKVTTVDSSGEKVIATYNYSGTKLTGVTSDDNSFKYTVFYTSDQISKIDYESVDSTSGEKTVNSQDLTYSGGKLASSTGSSKVNGALIYQSSTTYNYNGDKIKNIITKVKDDSNTTELFTIQTDYTFNSNNVSGMKYTITTAPGPVTIDPIVITTAFSDYDSFKNPLNTLPMAFKLVSSHFDLENNVASGLSSNNAQTMKVTSNVESITTDLKYDYLDGYPILGTSTHGTVAFEYVK
ncbi:hypothetical protein LUD75_05775 [Epilithonimonas sp. JDS]|uniref:hypothetical protein n=1 Tax=Epilithonimonas sp. JDS TaxID=2902797 RepID=UPI001E40D913|nr:hypothetical protein [Epilithonimonas sp. JDS]MCD9854202.1 hypothetical protein [Epilithonimonas sp. JDS]